MSSRLLAILACLMFMVVLSTASMGGVWRDDFDGAEIGPGWEYTNPPKQCEYEVAAGFFSLKLEGANDIWGGQDNAAKLLMEAPEGDYSLETHIVIEPDKAAKTANTWTSIIVFDDTDVPSSNWWYVARGGNNEVNVESCAFNAGAINASLKNIGDMELYLKAEKTGKSYTGYYKIKENDKWIKVGGITERDQLDPLKVGLLVKSWAVRSMVCNYDYFEIEGKNVKSNLAVSPNRKLSVAWGQLKEH